MQSILRTTRDSEERQRLWDDVSMMATGGPDKSTGRQRKCAFLMGREVLEVYRKM